MARDIIYYNPSIDANKQKLQHVQDIASLALGVGAGVLTLESAYGFIFYFVGLTVANFLFYSICCENQPKKFFVKPLQDVYLAGIFTNIAGYIMMWCLVYALVKSSS
ncbi:Rab5-interacting protein-domain-containing protein [Scheffersomyces xylosifermentans]|uniref:Rab5-interacting protein-domain-containing protein n=1 Tax=Scheffersomyces xylosifermentans TaxID=1304137 RepID=UPI00315D5C86